MTASCHQRTPHPQSQKWRAQYTEGSLRLRVGQNHISPIARPLAHKGSLFPSSEACRSLRQTTCTLCFQGLSTKTRPLARFTASSIPRSPMGSWAQEEGDSSPSGVRQCCLLAPNSIRKLWAGEQSSSPDPCLTHRGSLGKSLVVPPR